MNNSSIEYNVIKGKVAHIGKPFYQMKGIQRIETVDILINTRKNKIHWIMLEGTSMICKFQALDKEKNISVWYYKKEKGWVVANDICQTTVLIPIRLSEIK